MASVAPRPLLVSAATRDDDFDVSGVRDVLTSARPIYELFGRVDHLRAIYPESPHDFPDDARRRAYEFIDLHLKTTPTP